MISLKKIATPISILTFGLLLAGCSTNNNQTDSNFKNTTQTATVTNYTGDIKTLAATNYKSNTSPVVNVNNGQSTLDPDTWQTNKVIYANLDNMNRTSNSNTAYLQQTNVANDELRTTQTVKPTGWHQKFVNGEAILNRGHEIAYSLSKGIAMDGSYNPSQQSGDQNNPKNLFTQTAWANQKLQTVYESKVRNALKAGKKVVYQVTPVFNGNDLMAKGVQLQAISTDKSLNFNVFIYNVQPGINFNYADGTSTIDNNMKVPALPDSPNFNNDKSSNIQSTNNETPRHHHYVRDAIIAHEVNKHVFHHRF